MVRCIYSKTGADVGFVGGRGMIVVCEAVCKCGCVSENVGIVKSTVASVRLL